MSKQDKKRGFLGSITGHSELEQKVAELSQWVGELAQKGLQQSDVHSRMDELEKKMDKLEKAFDESQGLIKIPTARIGSEGHVQVLAEKIEATQARLDMLSLSVSKIKKP